MISKLIILSLVLMINILPVFAQDNRPVLRVSALKINVDEMEKALVFYHEKLGFEVADRRNFPKSVVLKSDDSFRLILNQVKRLRKTGATETGVGFTLQVNDLEQSIAKMKSLNVPVAETVPRREGVGNAIYILDPFGRKISLMHQTIVKVEPFQEPKIYNFGLLIPEMQRGRDFYENKLGFVARSEKYLPLDLPLGNNDKTFAFMLHYRKEIQPIKSEYPKTVPFAIIVFETADLTQTIKEMKQNNIKIVSQKKGRPVVFEDPFGNISELIESKK
jgi:catechol-2,3-dioxygenase